MLKPILAKTAAALAVAAAAVILTQPAHAQEKTKTERLLQTDLDPAAIDENGYTHMHWAALADDGEALKRLIEIGVFNMSPATYTEGKIKGKGKRRAQLLGMNTDAWNLDGETPLHLAAYFNKGVAASILIANGADIHSKEEDGWTPLHHAAYNNSTETAALLLKNGADVHAKNNYGSTPLHLAAQENATETAALLLKNGADVHAKNNSDWTPLDVAINKEHSEMQSLLKRHGGRCNRAC